MGKTFFSTLTSLGIPCKHSLKSRSVIIWTDQMIYTVYYQLCELLATGSMAAKPLYHFLDFNLGDLKALLSQEAIFSEK